MVALAALPTAPAYARAHVRSVLADWHMAALAESAQLVVSELVTNAVQASTREFGCPSYYDGHMAVIQVRLRADQVRLLIEVFDMAAAPPAVQHPAADDEGGRGLQLVGALTDRWGWLPIHGGPGKCVWAELCLEATSTGEACGVRSSQSPALMEGNACMPTPEHADAARPGILPELDVTVPNVARIYDYLLGGKNNFRADREAAEELYKLLPAVPQACRQNREFLRRAVRYLAGEAGIRQFVDIGSGLPTAENTHQIAQAVRPGARVVYVDNDPLVVLHGRTLLGSSPDVAVIAADLREPGTITGNPALRELVDFTEPVAFLLIAVLHFVQEGDDPYGIAGVLRSVMAPGSFLVVSHVTQDSVSAEEYTGGISVYEKASAPVVPRRYDEVLRFFDGMDLVDPGLVNICDWRTRWQPMRQLIYGGVGRKPDRTPGQAADRASGKPDPRGRGMAHDERRAPDGGGAEPGKRP